jgi:methylthioribose-1-phosphate isomerase
MIHTDPLVYRQFITIDDVPDQYAQVVVLLTVAEADALAAARIARAPSDLLADQAKPVAHAVADALVAAGYGTAP